MHENEIDRAEHIQLSEEECRGREIQDEIEQINEENK